ncbi:hypothetical protein L873DRAFT_1810564 [Choiromyces venosus 120613-1]|uniref:Uncharacterized protein n=1 Tax=Choiromyces venosus 120613-1 TaxID=1336337 RepID=A0A3N4JFJ9_9PEZI|nr:hypothetical protein L873DRAFT_1810564 [Choiromyces venosus 120613-1]
MENIDLNRVDGDDDTPILAAALGRSGEVLQLLFDCKGINRNQVNNKGNTLLHMSSLSGQEGIVMFLLGQRDGNRNGHNMYSVHQ